MLLDPLVPVMLRVREYGRGGRFAEAGGDGQTAWTGAYDEYVVDFGGHRKVVFRDPCWQDGLVIFNVGR